jgi:opacity protein-like surface antigen
LLELYQINLTQHKGKPVKKLTILTVLLSLNASVVSASEYSANVNLYLGNNKMSSADWGEGNSQGSIGLITDFKMDSWPVSIAVDGFVSGSGDFTADDDKDKKGKLKASSAELHLGVRKIWDISNTNFSPYIGGGLAVASGSLDRNFNGEKKNDSDSAAGTWVGTGVYWRPSDNFNVGADLRYSKVDLNLHDDSIEAGGLRTGLFVGYSW